MAATSKASNSHAVHTFLHRHSSAQGLQPPHGGQQLRGVHSLQGIQGLPSSQRDACQSDFWLPQACHSRFIFLGTSWLSTWLAKLNNLIAKLLLMTLATATKSISTDSQLRGPPCMLGIPGCWA